MSEITVRPLGEEDWQQYRDTRLTALRESPEAFAATLDEEEAFDEDFWRLRMTRSDRLLAERDGGPLGIVSVGRVRATSNPTTSELFGLWVSPEARGSGVATELVRAGAVLARDTGPAPARLLGRQRQRPRRGLRQRLRLPSHRRPSARCGSRARTTRTRSPWCSRSAATAGLLPPTSEPLLVASALRCRARRMPFAAVPSALRALSALRAPARPSQRRTAYACAPCVAACHLRAPPPGCAGGLRLGPRARGLGVFRLSLRLARVRGGRRGVRGARWGR